MNYKMFDGLSESELKHARNIINSMLEDITAARVREVKRELAPGTHVCMTGEISPKYLRGLTGKVVHYPEGKFVSITWDYPMYARRYGRSKEIKVPLTCVEVI